MVKLKPNAAIKDDKLEQTGNMTLVTWHPSKKSTKYIVQNLDSFLVGCRIGLNDLIPGLLWHVVYLTKDIKLLCVNYPDVERRCSFAPVSDVIQPEAL